jgi:excisionase family DNA binding protein
MPEKKTDLLTTDQVMDRLLSEGHLRALALRCVLPAVRVGAEFRFRKSDLEHWIEEQRVRVRSDFKN